jgi:hypothetical protein
MNDQLKGSLTAQLNLIRDRNKAFKALLALPPPPVVTGKTNSPMSIAAGLAPLLDMLKQQVGNTEQLIKVVQEMVAKG